MAGCRKLHTRIPPLFNPPSWILDKWNDEEYFSHPPPAMVVALVAVWLRVPMKLEMGRMSKIIAVLRRVNNPKFTLTALVIAIFDHPPTTYVSGSRSCHNVHIMYRCDFVAVCSSIGVFPSSSSFSLHLHVHASCMIFRFPYTFILFLWNLPQLDPGVRA